MNKVAYPVAIDHHICRIFFNEPALNAIDHGIRMVSKPKVRK